MRRRPALPALCAVLVLVVGQLLAFAHQAATRHVTCAEHGEELEAATLAEAPHACADDHLIGIDGDAGDHHDDCVVLRALHQNGAAPDGWIPPVLIAVENYVVVDALQSFAPAYSLYRLAPKTSPPVA